MYVATFHRTLVAFDQQANALRQVRRFPEPGDRLVLVDLPGTIVTQVQEMPPGSRPRFAGGPLDGCEYAEAGAPGTFTLSRNGMFGGADLVGDVIAFDRTMAREWELFQFTSPEAARNLLRPVQDANAFGQVVRAMIDAGKPISLHWGCGPRRIEGFLNIDKSAFLSYHDDYFLFDFTEQAWPIPDACVDYIYSEDFIEHIPQKNQIAFLAESLRVLKPGGYNRVNTPCLRDAMRRSDFTKGFAGVYFAEYDLWSHVALFTPESLAELARIIGYRHVFLTAKNRATSPLAALDLRPLGDRDDVVGNIFADLLK